MTTPATGACFYESGDGFGLSGVVPDDEPTGLFRDRFQEFSELKVRFIDVPRIARVDEPVRYTIELENTGLRDLTQVAVQELYPRNNELFDVVLRQGSYSCVEVPAGDSEPDCADGHPVQIPELGFVDRPWIRGENLVLPRGTSVRFEVQRPVATRIGLGEDDVINSRIDLYAGAVVGDGVEVVPASSSDTATIRIAGPAESLIIDDANSELTGVTADGESQATIVVQARDAFGGVPNVTVSSEITSGNSEDIQITSSAVTDAINGSATFIATTTTAADYEVEFSATIDGQPITTVPESLAFVAGPATALRFVSQPVDSIVGQTLELVSVELIDDFENRVLANNMSQVELTLDGGSEGGNLLGGDATPAQSGLVTFSGLEVDQAAEGYTLTASTVTKSAESVASDTSAPFTIEQAATAVNITQIVPDTEQRVDQPYTVSAEVDGGFNPTGTIEVGNGESSCVITAPTGSCALTSSSAQLGDITLTATYLGDSNNLPSAPQQAAYTIIAGNPHQLLFSVQPGNATAGQNFAVVEVSVLDEGGNLVDWDNSTTVELALVDSDGLPVPLAGTVARTVTQGSATFTTLSTEQAGNNYRLNASATGLEGASSESFDVAPAAPSKLQFMNVIERYVSGVAFAEPVRVAVVDNFDNVVVGDSRSITLRISDGIDISTIQTATAAAGVASFSEGVPANWFGQDLRFEAAGSPLFTTSDPFDVSVAAFAFSDFNDITAGITKQASVGIDASASDLDESTLIRYRMTLLDGNGDGVEGFVFTFCADGPVCNDFETLPPTDASGQTFFGAVDGVTAADAGILAGGGSSSLFEFELSPAGDYSLVVELLEVDSVDSSQLEWLGQGSTAFSVSD